MSSERKRDLTAALLLNALIMPGSGHYALGFRLRGSLIMGSIFLLVMLPIILFTAHVLGSIHNASESAAPMVRTFSTMGAAWHALRGFIFLCIIAILAIWIYSIIDVAVKIRRGKTQ